VPRTPDARALAASLAALPLVVDDVRCASAPVAVATYPGGARPSSVVTLAGGGAEGHGEHVGWTDDEHAVFRAALASMPRGATHVEGWTRIMRARVDAPYARAALEAAAIDLALRQADTNLFRLAGVPGRDVSYVVSFAAADEALADATRHPAIALKVDVDGACSDAAYGALAALGRVAVLDFKLSGDLADHARAHRAVPGALLEDPRLAAAPWPAEVADHVSFDAPVVAAAALARLPIRPAAVNVKPARMGGVFEALACIARCTASGITVYLGGMFETGVGRTQLRALAALFAPDGPNDIAPLALGDAAPSRPLRLAVDDRAPGFGDGAC
jgi:L-alanine-DL-glutamate epimerase-like enolase superfamily enzyme